MNIAREDKKMKITENKTTKALRKYLSINSRKGDKKAYRQRQICGYANKSGESWSLEYLINDYYNLNDYVGGGSDKKCYYKQGDIFCIARAYNSWYSNQVKTQIERWEKYADTEYSDVLNPIYRAGLHRGDKLSDDDDRYLQKSYIISQYAIMDDKIPSEYNIYEYALILNHYSGDIKEQAKQDKNRLEYIANNVIYCYDVDSANIGIIYDYEKRKYKVVLIDYGAQF